MAYSIVADTPGGAENLVFKQTPDSKPGPGELRIRHTAIGVNYIDVYHRKGIYKVPGPIIPGVEACGVVEELGEGVGGLNVGDRVAYGTATDQPGAYSTHRNIDSKYLVKVPDDIPDDVAATIMVKGMTAHYLLRRTFVVMPGNNIVIHSAAGGVGTYLCQWARFIGAVIIATVSSAEKSRWAMENGATYTVDYTKPDWASQVVSITGGRGVSVVYDGVGKDTFLKNFDCLMPLGLVVSYGQSSGAIPPFDVSVLSKGSFFLTRPTLSLYKSDRNELILSSLDLWEAVTQGVIIPQITQKFALKDAAAAHQMLEARQTMGSIVLIP